MVTKEKGAMNLKGSEGSWEDWSRRTWKGLKGEEGKEKMMQFYFKTETLLKEKDVSLSPVTELVFSDISPCLINLECVLKNL